MKGFSKYLLAGFLTMGLFACSENNDVPEQGGQDAADQVYMQFKMDFPSVGSRSTTDENGYPSDATKDYEVGNEGENTVTSIYVALVNSKTGAAVAQSYVSGNNLNQVQGNNQSTNNIYTVSFDAKGLSGYINEQVDIYVLCNPIGGEIDAKDLKTKDDFENLMYTLTGKEDNRVWTAKGFPMANAEKASTTLPASFASYKTPNNPFFLGTVKVERYAARFDYAAINTDNIYDLQKDENGNTTVQIQLTEVALMNLSKNFYGLRRVAADLDAQTLQAYNPNAITILEKEIPTNWVVDTDHAAKAAWSSGSTWENNFIYSMTSSADGYNHVAELNWTTLADIADNAEDQWDSEGTNNNDYHIWRYATENTIPTVASQVQAITTHVVFKGEIQATDAASAEIKEAISAKEPLFIYKDVLYGAWDDVETAAKNGGDNFDLSTDLGQAVKAYNDAMEVEGAFDIDALANAGFKRITPNTESNKYEVLYYYKNRHNDNNKNSEMGIMEFSVVRNNVYKLAVKAINSYGHPVDPKDPDPDPENPDDPDEKDTVYFEVSVEVLPWTVRVNTIEF